MAGEVQRRIIIERPETIVPISKSEHDHRYVQEQIAKAVGEQFAKANREQTQSELRQRQRSSGESGQGERSNDGPS